MELLWGAVADFFEKKIFLADLWISLAFSLVGCL